MAVDAKMMVARDRYDPGDRVRPNGKFFRVYPRARAKKGVVAGRCFVAGRTRVQWHGLAGPMTVDIRLIEPDD